MKVNNNRYRNQYVNSVELDSLRALVAIGTEYNQWIQSNTYPDSNNKILSRVQADHGRAYISQKYLYHKTHWQTLDMRTLLDIALEYIDSHHMSESESRYNPFALFCDPLTAAYAHFKLIKYFMFDKLSPAYMGKQLVTATSIYDVDGEQCTLFEDSNEVSSLVMDSLDFNCFSIPCHETSYPTNSNSLNSIDILPPKHIRQHQQVDYNLDKLIQALFIFAVTQHHVKERKQLSHIVATNVAMDLRTLWYVFSFAAFNITKLTHDIQSNITKLLDNATTANNK